jgi:scyllo-inositol 2-dehydrogenase (NADP+)
MIRVGIVGYGFAGRGFHAPLIGRVPGLRVTAVATRSPERWRQAEADLGVRAFESLETMLAAGDVDMVVLATPHDVHAVQALAALRAGKHVVIDKPMALTTAEADQLLEARDQAGVLLSVFHNRRWDWDYLTVRRALAEGRLGAPYLFETAVLRYKAPRGWRGSAEAGGGIVYDWGAHLIDQALQLVPGPVASVSCDIQHRRWGSEAGSYVRLLLRFGSGVLYAIEIGNLAAIGKPRWYVLGEAGALIKYGLDPQEPAMLKGDITQAAELTEERARLVVMRDGEPVEQVLESVRADWTDYYANVRDALTGRAPLAVRPEEARRVVAVLEAAVASAARHAPVAFEQS